MRLVAKYLQSQLDHQMWILFKKIFNRIREKLTEDTITHQIKQENFEEFSARVERTFAEFQVEKMDKTTGSMQKRIKLIIKSFGKRIKYCYSGFISISSVSASSEEAYLFCF